MRSVIRILSLRLHVDSELKEDNSGICKWRLNGWLHTNINFGTCIRFFKMMTFPLPSGAVPA